MPAVTHKSDQDTEALKLWLKQRRRQWWQSIRVLALTLALLATLHVAYEVLNTFVLKMFSEQKPNYAARGWEYYWVQSWGPLKTVLWIATYLQYFGAVFLAFSLGSSLRMPPEVVLSQPESVLYRSVLRYMRICAWILLVAVSLGPGLLTHATGFVVIGETSSAVDPFIYPAAALSSVLLTVEVISFLVLRRPHWGVLPKLGAFTLLALGASWISSAYQSGLFMGYMPEMTMWGDSVPVEVRLLQMLPSLSAALIGLGLLQLNNRPPLGFSELIVSGN